MYCWNVTLYTKSDYKIMKDDKTCVQKKIKNIVTGQCTPIMKKICLKIKSRFLINIQFPEKGLP